MGLFFALLFGEAKSGNKAGKREGKTRTGGGHVSGDGLTRANSLAGDGGVRLSSQPVEGKRETKAKVVALRAAWLRASAYGHTELICFGASLPIPATTHVARRLFRKSLIYPT